MKTFPSKIIVLLALVFVNQVVVAQLNDSVIQKNQSNLIKLPPLSDVIDSAIMTSFNLQAQDLIIEQKKEITSIEKKKILRALTFNSQYSRGNNIAYINNQLANQPYSTRAVTDFYSGGIFLNISVFQFVARKNNINNARLQIEIEKNKRETLKRNLTLKITNLYLDCGLKAKILQLRRDALSSSNINYSYAEKSFSANTLNIQTLTDVTEVNVKMKIAFEQAFSDYIKSIIHLEEYSGIKIRQL